MIDGVNVSDIDYYKHHMEANEQAFVAQEKIVQDILTLLDKHIPHAPLREDAYAIAGLDCPIFPPEPGPDEV